MFPGQHHELHHFWLIMRLFRLPLSVFHDLVAIFLTCIIPVLCLFCRKFVLGDLLIRINLQQIAVRSFDVYKSAEKMKEAGFTPSKEPGPVSGIGTKIVAFRDDDEWKVVMVDSEDVSTI